MKYRIYTRTEKSRDASHEINQDRYLFSQYVFNEDGQINLLLVADGMGGLEDGEKSSQNALKGFAKYFYEKAADLYLNAQMDGFSISYFAKDAERIIKDAICAANETVCKNADEFKQTGTTISVVCIIGKYAITANVGDSPIYFYRSKTKSMSLVSTLQTQAEEDVKAGCYERYSADYYRNDHILRQCLGQYSKLNEEDICCQKIGRLETGDKFLLGSDGAFGKIMEEDIFELLDECSSIEEEEYVLPLLFNRARIGKKDDQTALFYVVAEEE